jgi:hypothetical protein
MADQDQGHSGLCLQVGNQPQNLPLHGNVQGGGGFVRDQQFRAVGQRHCDHHPLALAA